MDDLDRLSLKSLRTVETVARLGTLGRAAQALGVSLGRLFPANDALSEGLLVTLTETTSEEDIDTLCAALKEVLA